MTQCFAEGTTYMCESDCFSFESIQCTLLSNKIPAAQNNIVLEEKPITASTFY